MKKNLLVFVVLSPALLFGCEVVMAPQLLLGLPASKGYEPETTIKSNHLVSIHTIAILEIPEPVNYGYADFLARKNTGYEQFSFANTTQAVLKKYLKEYDFEITEYSPNRERKRRLVYDYIALEIKEADAYLDIVPIKVGYFGSINGKREPLVSVAFRLVLADSNERIYAGSLQYGWEDPGAPASISKIESPNNRIYESIEALRANKQEAAEWLLQGIEAVSSSIARNIVEGKRLGRTVKFIEDKSSSTASTKGQRTTIE